MMSVIKFRSLFLALLVFTASGYGQAEQTMEQTEKWLNDYGRNEIRFIGADFGDKNGHSDYVFSECKLTGEGQFHSCAVTDLMYAAACRKKTGEEQYYSCLGGSFTKPSCNNLTEHTRSFDLDFSKVRPHEIQAEGNNVIKVRDETAWSPGKRWARAPIVVKPDTITRGAKALKHYAKLCNSELDSTF